MGVIKLLKYHTTMALTRRANQQTQQVFHTDECQIHEVGIYIVCALLWTWYKSKRFVYLNFSSLRDTHNIYPIIHPWKHMRLLWCQICPMVHLSLWCWRNNHLIMENTIMKTNQNNHIASKISQICKENTKNWSAIHSNMPGYHEQVSGLVL